MSVKTIGDFIHKLDAEVVAFTRAGALLADDPQACSQLRTDALWPCPADCDW